jgi:prepilin-type N-terminal cleavage/methylation domain-containing protein
MRARSKAHLRAGFTMIEVMIVVVIIGVMTITVTTTIESMLPGERLNTSIRNLSADLRSIRSEAISRGVEFRLVYDLDGNRYRWSTPFVLGEGLARQSRDEEWEEVDRMESPWQVLPQGVEFSAIYVASQPYSAGQVFVRFDPVGTASEHSVIMAQPQFNSLFTIEVMPLSGLVQMHDGLYQRQEPVDEDFN